MRLPFHVLDACRGHKTRQRWHVKHFRSGGIIMRRTIVLLGVALAALAGLNPREADGAVLASYTFGSPGQETTVESSAAFAPSSVAAGLIATPVADPAGTVGIEISSAATAPPSA